MKLVATVVSEAVWYEERNKTNGWYDEECEVGVGQGNSPNQNAEYEGETECWELQK